MRIGGIAALLIHVEESADVSRNANARPCGSAAAQHMLHEVIVASPRIVDAGIDGESKLISLAL